MERLGTCSWSEGPRDVCRQAPALPGVEGEAGSSSTPGLRRAIQSADEAQEKVPSAAGMAPAGQQQLPAGAAEIEEITPASGTAADEDRRALGSRTRCD